MIKSRIGHDQIELVGSQRQAAHIPAVDDQSGMTMQRLGHQHR